MSKKLLYKLWEESNQQQNVLAGGPVRRRSNPFPPLQPTYLRSFFLWNLCGKCRSIRVPFQHKFRHSGMDLNELKGKKTEPMLVYWDNIFEVYRVKVSFDSGLVSVVEYSVKGYYEEASRHAGGVKLRWSTTRCVRYSLLGLTWTCETWTLGAAG